MVITEHAAIDACLQKAYGVVRAHSIINALGDIGIATRNRRFEIDNMDIGLNPLQLVQCRAPNVRWCHRGRNLSVHLRRVLAWWTSGHGNATLAATAMIPAQSHRGKEHHELLWEAVQQQFEIAKSMGLRFSDKEPFFPQFYSTDDELRYYDRLGV